MQKAETKSQNEPGMTIFIDGEKQDSDIHQMRINPGFPRFRNEPGEEGALQNEEDEQEQNQDRSALIHCSQPPGTR
ncbi:hypothetical protein D1872_297110 [compost metagenome]